MKLAVSGTEQAGRKLVFRAGGMRESVQAKARRLPGDLKVGLGPVAGFVYWAHLVNCCVNMGVFGGWIWIQGHGFAPGRRGR